MVLGNPNIHRIYALLIHSVHSDKIILFVVSSLLSIKDIKVIDMGGVAFELGHYCLEMSF